MDDNDLLYHYTSASGLIGLLGTPHSRATMWMTQIQYMNDDAEFYHAYELAREEVCKLAQECSGVRRVISGLWGIPHRDENWGASAPVKGTVLHRYHSFSLTERADLLSQWRGYAPHGGYSVGFRVLDLQKLATLNRFKLIRCLYADSEKRSLIDEKLRSIETAMINKEVDLSIGNMHQIPEGEQADATARYRIQDAVNSMAPYFKHPSFAEEQEWRVVGLVSALDSRAKWRAKGSQIIPYCELDIGADGPHPVSAAEVLIGPGLDFEHCKSAIESMMFGSSVKPEVRASRSTFRT